MQGKPEACMKAIKMSKNYKDIVCGKFTLQDFQEVEQII